MVAISKATIKANIWENIYDRLSSQVSLQKWAGSWNDKEVTSTSSYPIGIINPVKISWEKFTLSKKWAMFTIQVDIYTTSVATSDSYTDSAVNALEGYRATFTGVGIRNLMLTDTSYDNFMRDGIKVHVQSITFTGRVSFTQTVTY